MALYPLLDLSLALLVVGVAAWTVLASELFGAVVGYVAYGLCSLSCGSGYWRRMSL